MQCTYGTMQLVQVPTWQKTESGILHQPGVTGSSPMVNRLAQGERNLILVVTTIFSLERPTGFNRSHQKKTLDSCHMVNGGTALFQRARGCPIILGQRERNCLVNEKNNRHVFRHFSASPFLFFPPLFSSSSFSFPLFSLWSGPLVSTGRTKKLPASAHFLCDRPSLP